MYDHIMTLTEVTGNLLDSDSPAIGHGVNCDGVMGAGIAAAFKARFPEMYVDYRQTCLAGGLQPGGLHLFAEPTVLICNIASQQRPGADARYDWLRSGVSAALQAVAWNGLDKLALPRIGCGIGGLIWSDVRLILDQESTLANIPIEVWTLPA